MNRASSFMRSSKNTNTGIVRYTPRLRYWSITSGFLSRRKTRVSTAGSPSTSRASAGKLYSASPHQSSVMIRMRSPGPSRRRASRSSSSIAASLMNRTNRSLLTRIWSRYSAKVMPCANRSAVIIRRLAHRREVDGELGDHLGLHVAHQQRDGGLRIHALGREHVEAPGGELAVVAPERGPLVLRERGLDLLLPSHQRGRVVPGEIHAAPPGGAPGDGLALLVLEHGLDVARLQLPVLEGGVARGQGQSVKRCHDHERFAPAPVAPHFAAPLIVDDAAASRAHGLLAIPGREGEQRGVDRSGARERQGGGHRRAPPPAC